MGTTIRKPKNPLNLPLKSESPVTSMAPCSKPAGSPHSSPPSQPGTPWPTMGMRNNEKHRLERRAANAPLAPTKEREILFAPMDEGPSIFARIQQEQSCPDTEHANSWKICRPPPRGQKSLHSGWTGRLGPNIDLQTGCDRLAKLRRPRRDLRLRHPGRNDKIRGWRAGRRCGNPFNSAVSNSQVDLDLTSSHAINGFHPGDSAPSKTEQQQSRYCSRHANPPATCLARPGVSVYGRLLDSVQHELA
jgi:hypothetical protein